MPLNIRLSLTTHGTGVPMLAFLKVQVCSSFPPPERPAYTGKLIASLFELVEKAEKRFHADDAGSDPKICE
jgi:hypothetical protein